jgi:hypothetical protein
MLTRKQIVRAVSLMRQVGELRPGFLNSEAANFTGPACENYPRGRTRPSPSGKAEKTSKGKKTKRRRVDFVEDQETGTIRFK